MACTYIKKVIEKDEIQSDRVVLSYPFLGIESEERVKNKIMVKYLSERVHSRSLFEVREIQTMFCFP